MKKGLTELVFVIDRSGSMGGLESDTIGGFNTTLEAHRKEEGEAVVSTVLFDNEAEVLHDRLPIAEVAPITEKEYWVRGCTALLDAVGGAVNHISRVHGYLPEEARPEHTIVVITTDGMENASREYGYDAVKKLISQKEEDGWQFLFLGANIDAAAEAGRIGISQDFAATYVADGAGTQVMHRAQCAATVAMRAGSPMPSGSWKHEIDEDLASRGAGSGKPKKRLGLFDRR
ncbi:MAG: VWA domain-containing protein [Eggerthellaceae bacterium]|nr:VWA domain-containing protein [Eggerthellaceae bacterium]